MLQACDKEIQLDQHSESEYVDFIVILFSLSRPIIPTPTVCYTYIHPCAISTYSI